MIKRLYSETELLLDDFEFHGGLNFIIGKYSDDSEARGINGIGKSSLVRLIDYCLLSDGASSIFLSDKYNFLREEEHTISLEFNRNETQYKILRSFTKGEPIFFGKKDNILTEYSEAELKQILQNLFFPVEDEDVIFEGNLFRTFFNFFVKDDLEHQERLKPLKFSSHYQTKKELNFYNFYLLKLPTRNGQVSILV